MNIPAFNMTLKRNILLLMMLMSSCFHVVVLTAVLEQRSSSRNTGRLTPIRSESRNGFRSGRTTPYFRPIRSKTPIKRTQSNQTLQNLQPQRKTPSPANINNINSESIDVQTKLMLVLVSIFTLIFVMVLLIIGHFTWFADIRKELEEEWQDEIRKEEERRIAKSILSEMTNPFTNLEDDEDEDGREAFKGEDKGNEGMYFGDNFEIRRRDSIDSVGCTRGLCFPPHHSILCPNNTNIPSLNEPLLSPSAFNSQDPIEYRNYKSRRSTEWMNLDSCVKVSEPIPVRGRTRGFHSDLRSLPKRPMTPLTPDPSAIVDTESVENRDPETGKFAESLDLTSSPAIKFDLSKLDLI